MPYDATISWKGAVIEILTYRYLFLFYSQELGSRTNLDVTNERIMKIWYSYTIVFYSALKSQFANNNNNNATRKYTE